tara:strand:+ start:676 stop:942 length:267 start_codon:yes stop_codon:yes gene_type:complete
MWNLNRVLLFVASLVMVIALSMSMANAEEKTYTLTEVKETIVNVPTKVGNFLTNEVEKTKEYQKESWADMKKQTAQTWAKLKSLVVKN